MKDLLIIGAGPAGITAAIYAVRYGLSVSVFEGLSFGGQVATTSEIENYPAINKIDGFDLSLRLYEQAKSLDVDFISENVISVDFSEDIKIVKTNSNTYKAKAVIIATGAKRRKLDCKGEEEFLGKGVSYCATCDGAFYRNKDVAIVGGGNTALEDALFLANICNKVYIVHRKNEFSAMKVLQESVIKNEKIEIVYNSTIKEIKGEKQIQSILINKNNEEFEKQVNGLFVAIGTEPDNKTYSQYINLDKVGYVIADETCKTNIDGVYVAGDCRTKALRQIVTATADGAVSAFMAANYINKSK